MIISDLFEAPQLCPECGGISFSDLILAEKKDACYYKVKASAKVWPSAYASGRLVQCRKKGADSYGNKSEGVAEATGDQKFDTMMSRITAEPKYPDREMPPTSIPELIQWADQNNKPYHKFFAQWAQKHRFTNVNDALIWVGDNVDPYDEFGPKDRENDFGDIVGEPLIDAAKHNPKAAELLKVFKCYEEIIDDWDDEYRQMNMAEKLGDNRPKLGSKRDSGKSVRKWRKSRGLDETDQVNEKSVSQAQFRTMAAAAHNPKFAKKVGISQNVAREFHSADKGSNYKKLPNRVAEGKQSQRRSK